MTLVLGPPALLPEFPPRRHQRPGAVSTRSPGPELLAHALGIDLTSEQVAAVTAPLEPNVVVAGAGSGKTSVMAARVVWLVASGQVLPEQILGLTFTNKAAAELAERIRGALRRLPAEVLADRPDWGYQAGPADRADQADRLQFDGEPTVSTYHAFSGVGSPGTELEFAL